MTVPRRLRSKGGGAPVAGYRLAATGAGLAGAARRVPGPAGPGRAAGARGAGVPGSGNAGASKGRSRRSIAPEFVRPVLVPGSVRWSRCSSAAAPLWSVTTETLRMRVRTRDLRYTPPTHSDVVLRARAVRPHSELYDCEPKPPKSVVQPDATEEKRWPQRRLHGNLQAGPAAGMPCAERQSPLVAAPGPRSPHRIAPGRTERQAPPVAPATQVTQVTQVR